MSCPSESMQVSLRQCAAVTTSTEYSVFVLWKQNTLYWMEKKKLFGLLPKHFTMLWNLDMLKVIAPSESHKGPCRLGEMSVTVIVLLWTVKCKATTAETFSTNTYFHVLNVFVCRHNGTFCVCQRWGFSCWLFRPAAASFQVKVACPEFVVTSLMCPDWQAESPHPLPVGPGAASHSQTPGRADRQHQARMGKKKKKKDQSLTKADFFFT